MGGPRGEKGLMIKTERGVAREEISVPDPYAMPALFVSVAKTSSHGKLDALAFKIGSIDELKTENS